MVSEELKDKTVCVVGLGYMGQPPAEAFSNIYIASASLAGSVMVLIRAWPRRGKENTQKLCRLMMQL